MQVLCGCCRSQFHVLPDKPRCGFSGGSGMSSVSVPELQCCEAGTYLSNLADICLLRLLVSLLEFLLPPAMIPASGRCSMSLHVQQHLQTALGYANPSLWGMVHCKDLTCAPVPALLISKYMDWGAEYQFNFLPMEHNETHLWLKNADNLWDEMSSRSSFLFKACGQTHLCIEEMGKTHMETARRLHFVFELQAWID